MSKDVENTRADLVAIIRHAANDLRTFDEGCLRRVIVAFESEVLRDERLGNHPKLGPRDRIIFESRFNVTGEICARARQGYPPDPQGFLRDLRIHEATLREQARDDVGCELVGVMGDYSCRVVTHGYEQNGKRAPFTPCTVCGQRLLADGSRSSEGGTTSAHLRIHRFI